MHVILSFTIVRKGVQSPPYQYHPFLKTFYPPRLLEIFFVKLISQSDAPNNYIQLKLILSSFSCNFLKKTLTPCLLLISVRALPLIPPSLNEPTPF